MLPEAGVTIYARTITRGQITNTKYTYTHIDVGKVEYQRGWTPEGTTEFTFPLSPPLFKKADIVGPIHMHWTNLEPSSADVGNRVLSDVSCPVTTNHVERLLPTKDMSNMIRLAFFRALICIAILCLPSIAAAAEEDKTPNEIIITHYGVISYTWPSISFTMPVAGGYDLVKVSANAGGPVYENPKYSDRRLHRDLQSVQISFLPDGPTVEVPTAVLQQAPYPYLNAIGAVTSTNIDSIDKTRSYAIVFIPFGTIEDIAACEDKLETHAFTDLLPSLHLEIDAKSALRWEIHPACDE